MSTEIRAELMKLIFTNNFLEDLAFFFLILLKENIIDWFSNKIQSAL